MWLFCRLVLLLLVTSRRISLASTLSSDLVVKTCELKKILEISLVSGAKYFVNGNTVEFSAQGKHSKVSSELSFSGPALLRLWNEDNRGLLIVTSSGIHNNSNESTVAIENGRVIIILYDAQELSPSAEALIRRKLVNRIKMRKFFITKSLRLNVLKPSFQKALGVSAVVAVYEVKNIVLQPSDSPSRLLQPSIQFGIYEKGLVFINSAGQETVITQKKVAERRPALIISNHSQRGLILISGINAMLYSPHTFRFPLERGPALVVIFDASKMTSFAESQVRDRILQAVKAQDPFTRDSISVWDIMGKYTMKILYSYGLHGVVAVFEKSISLSRRDPLFWDKSSLAPGDSSPDDAVSEEVDCTDFGNEHDNVNASKGSSSVEPNANHLSLHAQASPSVYADPTVHYQIGVGCKVEVSTGNVSFSYPLGKIVLNQTIIKGKYPVLIAENFTQRGLLIHTPRHHHCWLTGDVKKISMQNGPTIAVAYDASLFSYVSESHLRSQLINIIQDALGDLKSLDVNRLFQTISVLFSAWEPKPSTLLIAYPQINLAPEMSLGKTTEVGVMPNDCSLDNEDAILSTWLPDIFGPENLQIEPKSVTCF